VLRLGIIRRNEHFGVEGEVRIIENIE